MPERESHSGRVVALGRALEAGAKLESSDEFKLEAGHGIPGDRYAEGKGSFSHRPDEKRQLTLIQREKIESAAARAGLAIDLLAPRRNVVVAGIDLEAAIGRRLLLGAALIEVVSPCPPCKRLDRLLRPGVCDALKGGGGVYARVLESGLVRLGDGLVYVDERPPRNLP